MGLAEIAQAAAKAAMGAAGNVRVNIGLIEKGEGALNPTTDTYTAAETEHKVKAVGYDEVLKNPIDVSIEGGDESRSISKVRMFIVEAADSGLAATPQEDWIIREGWSSDAGYDGSQKDWNIAAISNDPANAIWEFTCWR